MNRWRSLLNKLQICAGSFLVACSLCWKVTVAEQPGQAEPLNLGSRLELFVDDYVIESMAGVRLKLHSPVPAGKAITFDKPWEGATSAQALVFEAEGRFRMYYRGTSHAGYSVPSLLKPDEVVVPEHPPVACYAESTDGVRWTRPTLGLFDFQGSRENNIVWMGEGASNFAPFWDANPAAPASERYKAITRVRRQDRSVLIALISEDGVNWKELQAEPVITDGVFDSLNVAFWDAVRGHYVAIYRDFIHGVRSIKHATSKDFRDWSEGQWGDFGDAPSEHLYTTATTPYFRAPHIYLAFPRRFLPWRTLYLDSGHPGASDAVFMSSRDGVHWDRRFLESFIRPGLDPRNWVQRANTPCWGLLPTAPDEVSVFVNRNYTSPSIHIERMVLRTDGFVSIHAGYSGGEMVTKPLTFQGDNLFLNFATSAAGSIRLEIQDTKGNPLPGFALEDSPLVWGDEIEHTVRWKRNHAKATSDKPLAGIVGKPIRLRFVMKDADLYSLRFR